MQQAFLHQSLRLQVHSSFMRNSAYSPATVMLRFSVGRCNLSGWPPVLGTGLQCLIQGWRPHRKLALRLKDGLWPQLGPVVSSGLMDSTRLLATQSNLLPVR